MAREDDIDRFYALLEELDRQVDGPYKLKDCTGYMDWPERGVYFFFEPGETRATTERLRVTRVGTHAVSTGSGTSLWDRLKQHYGTGSGSRITHMAAIIGDRYIANASGRRSSRNTGSIPTILTGITAGRLSIDHDRRSEMRSISLSGE
ncbi:MAG: hypothetical protein ABEH65_05100 [Halobacteriales archaeon]